MRDSRNLHELDGYVPTCGGMVSIKTPETALARYWEAPNFLPGHGRLVSMSLAGERIVAYSPESRGHQCTRSSHIAYSASALTRPPQNPTNALVPFLHSVDTA